MATTGNRLFGIKDHISYWSWSSHKERVVETALAKLRIGHVGVNKHLFRFELSTSNICSCGQIDSVEHYMLQCPKYVLSRTRYFLELENLKVPMTIKNILGGGEYPEKKQNIIINETLKYLKDTERIWDL
jgi:hypothetical protein